MRRTVYTPVKTIFKKQNNRSHDLFISDIPREKGPWNIFISDRFFFYESVLGIAQDKYTYFFLLNNNETHFKVDLCIYIYYVEIKQKHFILENILFLYYHQIGLNLMRKWQTYAINSTFTLVFFSSIFFRIFSVV